VNTVCAQEWVTHFQVSNALLLEFRWGVRVEGLPAFKNGGLIPERAKISDQRGEICPDDGVVCFGWHNPNLHPVVRGTTLTVHDQWPRLEDWFVSSL